MRTFLFETFSVAATSAGATVVSCPSSIEAAKYIATSVKGEILIPPSCSLKRLDFSHTLSNHGAHIVEEATHENVSRAAAGVTGANFAIAETGTIVLESTNEEIRLATTLPEKHFVILDPQKIFESSREALPHIRALQGAGKSSYLACITGPSRTADIERVLTIGVHGSKEVHILLLGGVSDDPMES